MSKRPTDHLEPASKRRNERQLTKLDASDEEEEVRPQQLFCESAVHLGAC